MTDIKVMLAEKHTLVREGIRLLLESDGRFRVVAETGDGEECVRKLFLLKNENSSFPDILVVDISLHGKDGFWVIEKVKEQMPQIKVLFLMPREDSDYVKRALEIGADGYLSKDADTTELKRTICSILDSDIFIKPKLYNQEIHGTCKRDVQEDADRMRVESLTRREREILIYVSKGMMNKEIGATLHITERTVKNHLSNIFKKLELSDRTQAALFAFRCRIPQQEISCIE